MLEEKVIKIVENNCNNSRNKKQEENCLKNIQVSLWENNVKVEQYMENDENKRLEENIYVGKVVDIVKGMQSAFVDIGEERKALLYIKDLIKKVSNVTGNEKIELKKYKIEKLVKPNDYIMVQVKRDGGSKQKGAKLTTDIKLTGNYLVINPNNDFVTVSKKIEDENKRNELIEIGNKIRKNSKYKNCGIIFRTASLLENVNEKVIDNEFLELNKKYEKIVNNANKILKSKNENKITKIYDANGIVGKLIRDFKTYGLKIIANNENIIEYVKNIDENLKISIDKELKSEELKSKIWLKCGGYIKIDKTEALIAIDVNSGKCIEKKDFSQMCFLANKEAAIEIAKQIRLQDLGGIIIIDFIDMENKEDIDKIIKIFDKELKKDRSKVQISEYSKLGLLELTRKQIYRLGN